MNTLSLKSDGVDKKNSKLQKAAGDNILLVDKDVVILRNMS